MSPSKDPASPTSSAQSLLKNAATPPKPGLALVVEEARFGICRLPPNARIPRWVHRSSFFTISRSREELSIVCEQHLMPEGEVPDDVSVERGWRAIRVLGPLDFSLIGVLASLAKPLTEARVSIFCISTYDTDYLLVRHTNLERAIAALEDSGHRFQRDSTEPLADKAASLNGDQQQTASLAPVKALETATTETAATETKTRPSLRAREAAFLGEVSAAPASPTPVSATPASPTPASATPTSPASYAKDRVARALADLSTALKAPWQGRTEKVSTKPPKADITEPVLPESALSTAAVAEDDEEVTLEIDASPESHKAAPTRDQASPERPSARRRRSVARTAPSPPGEDRAAQQIVAVHAVSSHRTASGVQDVQADSQGSGDEVEVVLDWDAEEEDGEVRSAGLFTGAIPQHDVEVTDQSFGHLGLSNPILETIHKVGFKHPTPIQAQVIPQALKGLDIIGLAETGSGKTAAFCLPLAERLTHGRGLRGLILCPTREIALQTKAFLEIFGRDHSLKTVEVIGGVRMGPQIEGFRDNPDILVATPGRLADHLRRRNVNLDKLEELVLDEADHMLDLGFLPQIKEILQQAPKERRTMMFSATMPPAIERLAQMFMQNPLQIDIRPAGQVAEGIEHRLYLVRDEDMKTCLLRLLEEVSGSTLVFSRRKLYTEWLARQMEQAGLKVARIHSDRSQSQRVQALRGFREGKYRILVATDVAARGLDVPRIEHVINYGLPETTEDYVHRAGRTARGNAVGTVSSIGTWQDKVMVHRLEHELGIKIPRCELDGVEPYKELPKRKGFRRRRLL